MSKKVRTRVFGEDIVSLLRGVKNFPTKADMRDYSIKNGYDDACFRRAVKDFWEGYWTVSELRHPLCDLGIHRMETWKAYLRRMQRAEDAKEPAFDAPPFKRQRSPRAVLAAKAGTSLAQLMMEVGGVCPCCGIDMIESADYELDHIYPVCRGGTDNYENIWFLCCLCNREKSGKDPVEWALSRGVKLPDKFIAWRSIHA